mgnify:FL=1
MALVAGIFCAMPSDAQKLTYNIIKELTVRTVSPNNYSGTDCAFELKVPYIKAENVQAQIPDLPSGVNFVSLRRSEYSDGESGTKIELWLNFADAGTYRLRSLRVYLNNKLYYIPFLPVVISENPRNILPQLVVLFENGTELVQSRRAAQSKKTLFSAQTGTPLVFTVCLQYGVQVVSFNWNVPRDALFKELERYDITQGIIRSSEFSEEKIPIARFQWEPLVSGSLRLPDFTVLATSYNGVRVELHLPEAFIDVAEAPVLPAKKTGGEELFGYAFTKKAGQTKKSIRQEISTADCYEIAMLREEERKSIPFTSAYRARKAFESAKGITSSSFEPTYFTFYCCLALFVIILLLLILSFVLKKLRGIITCAALFIVLGVCMIISVVQISATYAVFKGGEISPVPELTAGAVASIESGKRVRIGQRAGGWVFIQFGTSGGWVMEDEVIYIGGK